MSLTPICIICHESICGDVAERDGNGNGDFPVTTRCGHLYHNSCIRRWLASGNSANQNDGHETRCPICNKLLCQDTEFTRIYPVTELDEESSPDIFVPNPIRPAAAAPDIGDVGFEQICLLSKRNDGLVEEIQDLQQILGSTVKEVRDLQLELKRAQDELTKSKTKETRLTMKVDRFEKTLTFTEEDNRVIRMQLKIVQDELAHVKSNEAKLKLQLASPKRIIAAEDKPNREPENSTIPSDPQPSTSRAAAAALATIYEEAPSELIQNLKSPGAQTTTAALPRVPRPRHPKAAAPPPPRAPNPVAPRNDVPAALPLAQRPHPPLIRTSCIKLLGDLFIKSKKS